MTDRDREQFTRHLQCRGIRVSHCVVPYPWMPGDELAGKLFHHNVPTAIYERKWRSVFTSWRYALRVSCLKVPTHALVPRERTELPKLHIAA